VDHELERHVLAERAFWVACGLAVIGAVGSLIAAAGHTNRLAGVVVPFMAAAAASAVLALTYRRGRSFSAFIYLVSGLAIVYGLLLMLEVPMRLAVEGTCPPAPRLCTNGAEMQLTSPETLALSIAVGFGVLALLSGFFGLLVLYRHRPATTQTPSVWPTTEPPGWRRSAAKRDAAKEETTTEPPKADQPG
jgi:hypothetical protein